MAATKIQIICTSPGMRRNGVVHPASAFYSVDKWSAEQLAAFQADPNFLVRELEDGESTTTEADFEARVQAEVDNRAVVVAEGLQAKFDQAVADKAADKVAELQKNIDALETKLAAAEAAKPAAEKTTAKK